MTVISLTQLLQLAILSNVYLIIHNILQITCYSISFYSLILAILYDSFFFSFWSSDNPLEGAPMTTSSLISRAVKKPFTVK